MMIKKAFLLTFVLFVMCCMQAIAQYKVLITNLNSKEEYELKLNEEFYFGTTISKEVNKGKIDAYEIASKSLRINNKIYPISEIAWIDFKGRKPKKNTSKISKILFYFGAGLITFSAYEHLVAKDDKTAVVTASAGAICTVGALAFWVIPKQPRFDFTTKHLLELVQTEPAK
jgi:hypothetical protein